MKKTIKNLGNLDLTKYTPQALRSIKAIKKIGVVIIPSDASEEYYEAFSEITISDVGSIRKIPTNVNCVEINGFCELNKSMSENNDIVVVNGFCMAREYETDKTIKLIVNGFVIYEKDAPIEIIELNGFSLKINEKLDDCKFYSNSLDIDRDFIVNLEKNQVVIVGNELKIKSDVTLEMLKDRAPKFYVGNKIKCECSKEATGWIKVNSIVGNQFEV